MYIYERIKILRKNLGLSQPKFGEKMGVSRDVISNIELGRVEPKEMIINLICKTFNVNPLWLSEGQGKIFIDSPQSLIEDLSVEFDLNDTEKKIVSNFVNLSKEERNQIIELVKKLIT